MAAKKRFKESLAHLLRKGTGFQRIMSLSTTSIIRRCPDLAFDYRHKNSKVIDSIPALEKEEGMNSWSLFDGELSIDFSRINEKDMAAGDGDSLRAALIHESTHAYHCMIGPNAPNPAECIKTARRTLLAFAIFDNEYLSGEFC